MLRRPNALTSIANRVKACDTLDFERLEDGISKILEVREVEKDKVKNSRVLDHFCLQRHLTSRL